MTLPELETILASLDPQRDWVRLMGGEPALHSRYPEVIRKVKAYGFQVAVFTNGLHSVLWEVNPCLPDRVLVNVNDWLTYTSGQQDTIRTTLSVLGGRASLAYTILTPAFDLSMHRQLILEAGLQPVIRLGLAQPVIGGDNAYLQDADLPAAHRSVVRWAEALSADGIRLSMDCGFRRGLFGDADIETLVRAGTVLNFNCAPVLDVGPGLKVWRCFAFSAAPGVSWSAFEDVDQLRAWFEARDAQMEKLCGQYDCEERDLYGGGCLARRIRRTCGPSVWYEHQLEKENVGIE